jgi:DNA primase
LRDLTESVDVLPLEAADVTMSIARLDARRLETRINEIIAAMRTGDDDEQRALMRERLELEVELRRLLPIRSPRGKPKA